ncbi:terminase small subunit [Paraburkholderia sacchari]|uniref:terminase small subunit n=1 Tax=Paraburkholderia sacchari TaxID=159450 RepID=UPI000541DA04|nr:terminase small subunit [Paraburkholderia sacchari]NLP64297.1 terminase small subunit [Paraburkholderia sacchari]
MESKSLKTTGGVILSRADLSAYCGIDPKTLDAWVRDGCPILREGSRGVAAQFNSADVWRWREERLRSKLVAPVQQRREELELRKLEAQTVSAELEMERDKGAIAPVDEFERATAKLMTAIRTNMLNVVRHAELSLLGETDRTKFAATLRRHITDGLQSAALDAENVFDEEEPETEI